MSIWQEIKDSFKFGTIVTKLIYVNLAVFLFFRLVQLFLVFGTGDSNRVWNWIYYFSVPSSPSKLILQPWSVLSYMFLHYDFLHLLFNILYLYWFGKLLAQFVEEKLILKLYIIGGISGALLYLIAFNFIPGFYKFTDSSMLLGASAAVMAILFAVAALKPNYVIRLFFIGDVRLKYVALVAFLIDLISIPTMSNTGGHLAHIGGAIIGVYYGLKWAKSSMPQGVKINKDLSWILSSKPKMKVTHKRPLSDLEYNSIKVQREKEVDRILEKIKQSGYDSLTSTEKKTLFDASNE